MYNEISAQKKLNKSKCLAIFFIFALAETFFFSSPDTSVVGGGVFIPHWFFVHRQRAMGNGHIYTILVP